VADRRERALEFLSQAIANGCREPAILEDRRLDSLRGDPEFERIVKTSGLLDALPSQDADLDSVK
jgi:hypothetical protein